jgi:exodeoxyribonuclease VII large subunit
MARRLAVLQARLAPAAATSVGRQAGRFGRLAGTLQAVSPLATLERGYSIVRRIADGSVVVAASQAPPGTELDLRLAQGSLAARVTRSGPG